MKHITSRENPLFRSLLRLASSSRERRKLGLTVLDGVHLVSAYIERFGAPHLLVVSESGMTKPEIGHLLERLPEIAPAVVADALFGEIAPTVSPSGIVAAVATPRPGPLPSRLDACLMLDAVQDPGNVGSILRSAAAAGVGHVLLSAGCAYAWAPRVVRAGMGGHFEVSIHENADLLQIAQHFRGQVITLSPDARTSLFDCDLTGPTAFIIGNEGAGVSSATAAAAHREVRIPMPGAMESLNAAAAAAICLFERVRQIESRKT